MGAARIPQHALPLQVAIWTADPLLVPLADRHLPPALTRVPEPEPWEVLVDVVVVVLVLVVPPPPPPPVPSLTVMLEEPEDW